MNDSFDRDIKKMLEDSNPEALGYRPDREKLWQRIEGKQKRKRKVLPLWISHAAAVAAGLLIGIVILSRDKEEAAPTVTSTIAVPIVKTVRDTVFITQPAKKTTAPAGVATMVPTTRSGTRPITAPAKITDPVQEQEPQPAIVPPQQEPLVATVAPAQKKVLHLADIGNENALPRPRKKQGGLLLTGLSNRDQADTYQETLSILVGKQFAPAKTKADIP